MRSAVKRRSNVRRHWTRDSSGSFATAATASSMVSQTKPVTPWSMTSGTEPRRKAITGVPHAMDSAMTIPNGSGQSIGNTSAAALHSSSCLSRSPISPMNSTCGWPSSGLIFVV